MLINILNVLDICIYKVIMYIIILYSLKRIFLLECLVGYYGINCFKVCLVFYYGIRCVIKCECFLCYYVYGCRLIIKGNKLKDIYILKWMIFE